MRPGMKRKVINDMKELSYQIQSFVKKYGDVPEFYEMRELRKLTKAMSDVERSVYSNAEKELDDSLDESYDMRDDLLNESFSVGEELDVTKNDDVQLHWDFTKFMDDQLLREGQDSKRKQEYFNSDNSLREARDRRTEQHVSQNIKIKK